MQCRYCTVQLPPLQVSVLVSPDCRVTVLSPQFALPDTATVWLPAETTNVEGVFPEGLLSKLICAPEGLDSTISLASDGICDQTVILDSSMTKIGSLIISHILWALI